MLRTIVVIASLVCLAFSPVRADQTDIGLVSNTEASVAAATSLSIPNVAVTGNNKLLLVGVSLALGSTSVSSVNYNPGSGNVALTRQVFRVSGGTNVRVEIWSLTNPANAAAGTVTITTANTTDIIAGTAVFANVDQTTPISGAFTNAANSNNVNVTSTSIARNAIFGVAAVNNQSTVATPGAQQTELWNLQTAGASGGGTMEGMGGMQTGSQTSMAWALSAGRAWAMATVVLQSPALAPTLARYRHARAAVVDGRTRVSFTTGLERDNLGFRVFREDATGRKLITPDLIAGSGVSVSSRRATGGRSYACEDPGPVDLAARYYIEDVDRHGVKTWFGPIAVSADASGAREVRAAERGRPLRSLARRTARRAQRAGAVVALGTAPATNPEAMRLGSFAGGGTAPGARERARQREVAGRPAVKLAVEAAGWYRVDRDALVAAGVPADVDPRSFVLHADGREAALLVRAAREKRFVSGDVVEFFGTGQDTLYSGRRVYWLTWDDGRGDRVTRTSAPGALGAGASAFPFAVERRDRTLYIATVKNGDADNFYGAVVMGTPVDQDLELPHVHAPGVATVSIALEGLTDHHAVAVALNGHPLGVVEWNGQARKAQSFSVPADWLASGTNTVRLTGSSDEDVTLVEYVRVDYPHAYTADGDALLCTAAGGAAQTIRGFSRSNVRVVDVTDPHAARELAGRVQPDGGGFAVAVTPPGAGARTLLAFTDDRAAAPAVETNRPSRWTAAFNSGALVLLSHASFVEAVEPLRARRAAQLGTAVTVDVTDLYDELSFGAKDPAALRDFLTAAASWRVPPQHVLIVGDATFNPRNFAQDYLEGQADFDFVPTKLVQTQEFETASDDWLADRDGDGAADLPIGRLPVRTPPELAGIVAKLFAYEDGPSGWARSAVFVSDAPGGGSDFQASALEAASGLTSFAVQFLSMTALSRDAVRAGLLAALDAGTGLVVYFGHGSQEQWSEPGIYGGGDASRGSAARAPVIVAMTCLSGMFHDLFVDCLAKQLLRAEAGAVALFACTGFCAPDAQALLARGFLSRVSAGATLGEAAVLAKRGVPDRDVRATWMLFGDPSMKLR